MDEARRAAARLQVTVQRERGGGVVVRHGQHDQERQDAQRDRQGGAPCHAGTSSAGSSRDRQQRQEQQVHGQYLGEQSRRQAQAERRGVADAPAARQGDGEQERPGPACSYQPVEQRQTIVEEEVGAQCVEESREQGGGRTPQGAPDGPGSEHAQRPDEGRGQACRQQGVEDKARQWGGEPREEGRVAAVAGAGHNEQRTRHGPRRHDLRRARIQALVHEDRQGSQTRDAERDAEGQEKEERRQLPWGDAGARRMGGQTGGRAHHPDHSIPIVSGMID